MSPSLTRDSTTYLGVQGQLPSPVGPKPARSDHPLEETRTSRTPSRGHECPRNAISWPERSTTATSAPCATLDPNLPVAHAGDRRAEALQTTCAHVEHAPAAPPEGGSHAVHVGTAAGSPAAAPEHVGTEVPRHPNTVLGGDEASQLTHPHDPSTRRIFVAVPSTPRPTALATRCCHQTPATRSEDPTAATCVPTNSADHGNASHHRAAHAVSTFGPRPKPRPSRERLANMCEKLVNRTSPPVLLGTSSRQPISSDPSSPTASTSPPTRPAPWIRASSPYPNHACQPVQSHRVGASPDSAVGHTNRSPRFHRK